jgi:hypothetical protein
VQSDALPSFSCLSISCRNAALGDKRLFVSSTAKFSINAWVRLLLDNRNNSLVADLHSGLIPPDPAFNNRNDAVMFNFKVTEVGWLVQSHQLWHAA